MIIEPTISSIDKGFCHVIISDSRVHAERLVFPAIKKQNTKTGDVFYGILSFINIAGESTFIYNGGDTSTILEDQEYLDQIIKANK
jgi:hypothetical protein